MSIEASIETPSYRDSFIDRMMDRRKKAPTHVYLAECAGFLKIGVSSNPRVRIYEMQTGCPFEIVLIALIKCNYPAREEKRLHGLFKNFRVRGEWFKLNQEDMNHLLLDIRAFKPYEPRKKLPPDAATNHLSELVSKHLPKQCST